MNRFQKKCFIGSTGAHLLLVVVLFIGPAFLTSRSKVDDLPPLDFVPWKTVDAAVSGGGNPHARPPVAVPTPPVPAPPVAPPPPVQAERTPVREKDPEPPKDPPRDVVKTADESFETSKTHKSLPKVSTKIVNAKPDNRKASRPTDSQQQDQADAQRRRSLANAISGAAHSLRDDVSAATTVDTNYGPGGGGEAYANYAQVVKTIYEREWVLPDTAADDAITKVKVTIASDGRVISSDIVRASGESSVDKSVQRTLDRVRFIRPFPEGSKDKERTYTINFSLRAKRLLG